MTASAGAFRLWSWPMGCLGLLFVGLAILAVPARLEGPALLAISPGHAVSLVDAVGIVPVLAGASWLHLGLWSRRGTVAAWLRERPAAGGTALFAAGLGLGLLMASAFSTFFWWWAIGAVIFGLMHIPVVTAASRQ